MVVQKNGELIIRAEQIIDEAYKKGWEEACDAHDLYTREEVDAKYEEAYDKGYQRGLDDAWEAAKKIALAVEDGGLPNKKAFGMQFYQVFRDMSVTEVIEKIRKYEQVEPEQVDDEIRVGDEVIYQRKSYDPHNGENGVVIGNSGDRREVRFLSNWSSVGVHENSLIKTGRHFSQIEEVLKQMQEVQE